MGEHAQPSPLFHASATGSLALTAFDHTLLAHLSECASNLQIAMDVGRSEKTVGNRLSVLYQKLGVPNRAVAVWLRHSPGHSQVRPTEELPL